MNFWKWIVGFGFVALLIYRGIKIRNDNIRKEQEAERQKQEEAAKAAARDPHERKDITGEATEKDVK